MVLALPLLAACGDRATGPGTPVIEPPPSAPASVAALECLADVKQATVECASGPGAQSGEGARLQQHVLGGQGTYVRVTSSGVGYAGGVFSFDVSVQNLVTQAMGTTNGTTRDDEGIRVFFHQTPVVTGGTGIITVANATGTGTFTAGGQPYYQYGGKIDGVAQGDLGADGVLSASETSGAKTWRLTMPATVASFSFQVMVAAETPPGALVSIAPQVTGMSPATLVPGQTATLTGTGFNAVAANNTVTIGGVQATVTGASGTQLQVTVPCTASGTVAVQVTASGRRGNTFAHPLQVPQRVIARGRAAFVPAPQSGCNEIPASGGTAWYVVAVYNTSTAPQSASAFQIGADAQGAPAQAMPDARPRTAPAPGLGMGVGLDGAMDAARRRLADEQHQRLLEFNRRENERLRAEFAGDPRMQARRGVAVNAAPPPTTKAIRVVKGTSCNNYFTVNATRVYYAGKLAIYEDNDTPAGLKAAANPTMRAYYNAIGNQYNADMEPIVRNNFGDPLVRDAGTDNNGVLIALFTPLVNSQFPNVAGFVVSCDQYPVSSTNGGSNDGEYFYAYQPRVLGTGYQANTPDQWYQTVRGTFIHETKHAASYAARRAKNAAFEDGWLEEGTARHAEELWARNSVYNVAWKGNTGYGSSASRGSIYCDVRPSDPACTATNPRRPARAMIDHFAGLYPFMAAPATYSPFGSTPSDGTSVYYAASWSLVRYAIDRYGASDAAFLSALNGSTSRGAANLTARAGVTLDELMGGWALALYMDNHPSLTSASTDTQIPTWNFASIFAGLNADFPSSFPAQYPLVPTAYPFGSFGPVSVPTLYGGSVSYFVLAGTHARAQLLRLTGTGGAALPSGLRVAIGRIL